VDGVEVETEEWLTYCAAMQIPFEYGKSYRVEAKYKKLSDLEKAKLRAKEVLTKAEGDNDVKYRTYGVLIKAETMEEFWEIIENSKLAPIAKLRMKETI
jgi:hypothetical protein